MNIAVLFAPYYRYSIMVYYLVKEKIKKIGVMEKILKG